jgi:ArsR family transcriptional regulator
LAPDIQSRRLLEDAATDCNALTAPRMAAICKALAHPVRLQIVSKLRQIDRCVCGQIVNSLPLAQSTVSQHLKILRQSGLIRGEVEGLTTCYCLNAETLAEFKAFVSDL